MTITFDEPIDYLPLDERLARLRTLNKPRTGGPKGPRFRLSLFLLALLLFGLLAGLRGYAQQADARQIVSQAFGLETVVPKELVVTFTDDEKGQIREALRLAAQLIRMPGEEGDRILSVTAEEDQQQRTAARKVREALALFGESVK